MFFVRCAEGHSFPSLLTTPEAHADVVFVPGLGFDAAKRRLGRGKGYYGVFPLVSFDRAHDCAYLLLRFIGLRVLLSQIHFLQRWRFVARSASCRSQHSWYDQSLQTSFAVFSEFSAYLFLG